VAVAPIATDWLPRPPDDPRASLTTTIPVAAGVPGSASSSTLLPLVLGGLLLLSLVVAAIAAIPPWVMPRNVNVLAYEHRETIVAGGVAAAVSIGLGLAIALVGS
jgi:hypothetical protein